MPVGRLLTQLLCLVWSIALHVCSDVGSSNTGGKGMVSGDTSTQRASTAACVREPGDGSARTSGDNGFRIKIIGQQVPALYTPGQVYTISLNGTYSNQKLVGFMLVAVPRYAHDESTMLGFFQHIDTVKTRFAEKCPHIVTNVYRHHMAGIEVLWMAPPSGTGCVEFRAMVVEQRDVWYKDDGALTLVFCEDISGENNVAPSLLPDCGACGVAKYQMTFQGLWSKETHPRDFPTYQRLLHWSATLGASHKRQYAIWRYGDFASEAIRDMCEFGYTFALEREMKKNSALIRTVIKMPGVWWSEHKTLASSRWARFSVDRYYHLLSIVTMFGPSPDWCVGVSALNLCLANNTWTNELSVPLYPWDAGTDDGDTYLATNVKSEPQQRIHRLTNIYPPSSPFFGRDPVRPLAMLTLQRIHSRHDDTTSGCDNKLNSKQPQPSSPEIVTEEDDINNISDYSNVGNDDVNLPPLVSALRNNTLEDACAVTVWSDWSECSVTCGWGLHQRERSFVDPSIDRKKCIRVILLEIENCQASKLDCQQISCEVGQWSAWSACSVTCRGGVVGEKIRTRLYMHAVQGNRQCSVHLTDIEGCATDDDHLFPDCAMTSNTTVGLPLLASGASASSTSTSASIPSTTVSTSTVSTGGITSQITVSSATVSTSEVTSPRTSASTTASTTTSSTANTTASIATSGALESMSTADAPTNITTSTMTSDNSAIPIDCLMSEWTKWSACSATCGDSARRTRRRYVIREPEDGGKDCPEQREIHKACKIRPCTASRLGRHKQPVNCKLSSWSVWSACSSTCDEGYRQRTRRIKRQPNNAGQACPLPSDLVQKDKCKLPPCDQVSSCELGSWNEWTRCTGSCGNNHIQERTRTVHKVVKEYDVPCEARLERRYCLLPPCPNTRPRLTPTYLSSRRQ